MPKKKLPEQVFKKAAHLQKEGKPRNEAIGEAAGMYKSGRLTKEGGYIRGKGKGKKRH